ncbi:hypothetical protein [Natrinema sp. 1APR25-10V2]|uniref:hypothetical protein n=1 Tax=Natrinema sp. 1APR25-10V2 TaxID=2951081 RepID=UPI00287646E6|nr:hypothetical protein [Natrinema sp. 1APR25-10V2]MDS0474880.1 hypothetical protein [Natrinema sp. 1APR25-10V2]
MSDAESDDEFAALLADATEGLQRLDTALADADAIDDLDDDVVESLIGDIDALARVAAEVGELLEEMDLSELPEAVEEEELLDAIEVGKLPAVLADEDTDATELVAFRELFDAIDLLETWNAADLTGLWEEKRELDDALDDLEDSADAGTVEKAVSEIAASDERLFGEDGELLETDMDTTEAATQALGDIDVADDPEAYQAAIQQQAIEGIDAFRAALLETHAKFERLYEFNREKMRRQDTSTNSRNPTAASTISTDRADLGGGARYSTVPREVKLSTAPTRKRIYGRRFELERERRRRESND